MSKPSDLINITPSFEDLHTATAIEALELIKPRIQKYANQCITSDILAAIKEEFLKVLLDCQELKDQRQELRNNLKVQDEVTWFCSLGALEQSDFLMCNPGYLPSRNKLMVSGLQDLLRFG